MSIETKVNKTNSQLENRLSNLSKISDIKLTKVKVISDEPKKEEKDVMRPKQTCLEKRGISERHRQIARNFDKGGYVKGDGKEYSARHKNAISNPSEIKGKGINSGGHTYFQPNYGKPKENPNSIDYQNFLTVSDKTRSIGGKIDIETRDESYLMRRYNYDTNEYSSKNEDALSSGNVLGKGTGLYLDTLNGGGGYDVMAREEHLMRNEWKKNLQYTKTLVNAEYDIQTEFKISSYGEDLEEMQAQAELNQINNEIRKKEKAAKKAEKKKDKNVNKKADEGNVDNDGNKVVTKPKQTLVGGITPDNSAQYEAFLTNPYAVAMGGNSFNQ